MRCTRLYMLESWRTKGCEDKPEFGEVRRCFGKRVFGKFR
jgi:hypothetical protein